MEIEDLIQSEQDRKELFSLTPQNITAREYFSPSNPAYAEMDRRQRDLQLLQLQSHSQYYAAASQSAQPSMAASLMIPALTGKFAMQKIIQPFKPVEMTPYGYESNWFSDVKLAAGHFNYPYNVRPGMAQAMGFESLAQRVSSIPGVSIATAASIAAWEVPAGAIGGIMGGPKGMAIGVGAGLAAEYFTSRALNPALRAGIQSYENWLQNVDWRINPAPASTMTGVGLSPTERTRQAYRMATLPYFMTGVNKEMVNVAAQQGLASGLLGGTGTNFANELQQVVAALKSVTQNFNQNLNQGMATVQQMRSMGMSYAQMQNIAPGITAMSRTAGVSYAQMWGAGMAGGQLAQAMRMPGMSGVAAGMQAQWMASAIARGGALSPDQMARMGGITGITQTLTQQMVTGAGQPAVVKVLGAAYRDGKLSQDIIDKYLYGSLTSKEINSLYNKNVMKNKTTQYEFAANLPGLIGTINPMVNLSLQMESVRRSAEKAGLDVHNRAAMVGYMGRLGYQNPEVLMETINQSPAQMMGAIYSDIQYQDRLDKSVLASPTRALSAPLRSLKASWGFRGKGVVFWSQMQKANLQEKMFGWYRRKMGIYDVGIEKPTFEYGTPEWYNMYMRSSGDDTWKYMSSTRYTDMFIRGAGNKPTLIEGSEYSVPVAGRTSRYSYGMGGGVGGGPLIDTHTGRAIAPRGYADVARELSRADLSKIREGPEYDKVMASIASDKSLRRELVGAQGSMTWEYKKAGMKMGSYAMGALAAGGLTAGVGTLAMGLMAPRLYHKWFDQAGMEARSTQMDQMNSISMKLYGKKMMDLTDAEQRKSVATAYMDYTNTDLATMADKGMGWWGTAGEAKKHLDKKRAQWTATLKDKAITKGNIKLMDKIERAGDLTKLYDYTALYHTADDPMKKKEYKRELSKMLWQYRKQGGLALGGANVPELLNELTDNTKDRFCDIREIYGYMDASRKQAISIAEADVKSYVSGALIPYYEEKGNKLMVDQLETLTTQNMSTDEWLLGVDVKALKEAKNPDGTTKMLIGLAEAKQKMDKWRHGGRGIEPMTKETLQPMLQGTVENLIKQGFSREKLIKAGVITEAGPHEPGKKSYAISLEGLESFVTGEGLTFAGGKIGAGPRTGGPKSVNEAQMWMDVLETISTLKKSVENLDAEISAGPKRYLWPFKKKPAVETEEGAE